MQADATASFNNAKNTAWVWFKLSILFSIMAVVSNKACMKWYIHSAYPTTTAFINKKLRGKVNGQEKGRKASNTSEGRR